MKHLNPCSPGCRSDEAAGTFAVPGPREVCNRFKALLTEPSAFQYALRRDNLESIYKKLEEKRDTADVTAVLKELHRIVNEAIRAAGPGQDHAEGLTIDLSQIDFEKLKEEFGQVRRKNTALQDIRGVVERKIQAMVNTNPLMMDYYRKYQEIIAEYNREKDRTTVEQTFAALVALAASLDEEQQRAVEEGLSAEEMAIFDLLKRDSLTKADRERVKQASKAMLLSIRNLLAPMDLWTRNAQTQAEVQTSILDWLYETLPQPPFTEKDTNDLAERLYEHVWQAPVENAILDSCEPTDERAPYLPTPQGIKVVSATIRQTWSRAEHCRRLTDIDESWNWFLSQFRGQKY